MTLLASLIRNWMRHSHGSGRNGKSKFAVTVVSPPGYMHSAAFNEIAETIHYGLRSLGYDSVLTTGGALPRRLHIVLGANLLPRYSLPLAPDAILYNLEQVQVGSKWFRPELIDIFRRYALWDYSQQNAAALAALGVRVERIVPVGYVQELTRIRPAPERDIDVLFFGSMNPRRQETIDRMREVGLKVTAAFGVYGPERDALDRSRQAIAQRSLLRSQGARDGPHLVPARQPLRRTVGAQLRSGGRRCPCRRGGVCRL